MLQHKGLHKKSNTLQKKHGAPGLSAVYGAGCVDKPDIMFIFMNPTGRNVSANLNWKGLRAAWLGTKQVWGMFRELDLLSQKVYEQTQALTASEWDSNTAEEVYKDLSQNNVYITNLAKCTQVDAKPLPDKVFSDYLEHTKQEILLIKPKHIVTFGNQVSSVLLNKKISVSDYKKTENETIYIEGSVFNVYPTFYPVGQGRRNQTLSVKRIQAIINLLSPAISSREKEEIGT